MRKIVKKISKNPEVRRTEIISVAEKLFEKNGYGKTPVESIIKKVGIAKGTFYYYFKSKKDILRAIVEQIGMGMAEYFSSIVEIKNLTAIEKLQRMIRSPKKKAITESSVMRVIHKPENRELQEQLNIQSIKIIAPLMAKVLAEGYKEGFFKKLVSVESIQLMLAGSQFILDSGLFEWSPKKRMVFLKSIQTLFEELVGVKPGVLGFISDEK
jgi:AcrR family transcriptional regulator